MINQFILSQQILIKRAVRFSFTGLLNTAVHVLIASTIIEFIVPVPAFANGVAFIVATLVSYLINTKWSFSSQLHGKSLFRYSIVSILGFFLAVGISGTINMLGFSYWYGIAGVICVMTPTNFLLHHFWTYR